MHAYPCAYSTAWPVFSLSFGKSSLPLQCHPHVLCVLACCSSALSTFCMQIQASLGEGHVNLVQARELLLTKTHLGLAMEYVSGGNLTGYVTEKWDTTGLRNGLFLSEDEARYIFKVRTCMCSCATNHALPCFCDADANACYAPIHACMELFRLMRSCGRACTCMHASGNVHVHMHTSSQGGPNSTGNMHYTSSSARLQRTIMPHLMLECIKTAGMCSDHFLAPRSNSYQLWNSCITTTWRTVISSWTTLC